MQKMKCPVCDVEYYDVLVFGRHYQDCMENNQLKCEGCQKEFPKLYLPKSLEGGDDYPLCPDCLCKEQDILISEIESQTSLATTYKCELANANGARGALVDMVEKLKKAISGIKAGGSLYCVYCGLELPAGIEVRELQNHVNKCSEHPIADIKQQNIELVELVRKVTPTKMELSIDSLAKIKDHDYMEWPVKASDYRECAYFLAALTDEQPKITLDKLKENK